MNIDKIEIFKIILKEIPEIHYAGNAVLREKTEETSLEDGLEIAKKLEKVLLKYREITGYGRGLAAPQIGMGKSVFITFLDDKTEVFINPRIIEKSTTTNFYKELCMSAGILAADVERPEWIVMEWTDGTGINRSEKIDGFKARLYQHEEAHVRGHLNLDDAVSGGIQFVNFDPLKETLRDSR